MSLLSRLRDKRRYRKAERAAKRQWFEIERARLENMPRFPWPEEPEPLALPMGGSTDVYPMHDLARVGRCECGQYYEDLRDFGDQPCPARLRREYIRQEARQYG